jgi:hypothetical protein
VTTGALAARVRVGAAAVAADASAAPTIAVRRRVFIVPIRQTPGIGEPCGVL